jgi:cyclophilin family peptidyl-prolyl cis-trans isomerase
MMRKAVFLSLVAVLGACPAMGDDHASLKSVRAVVRPLSRHVPPHQPVMVQFLLENTSDEAVTLSVPNTAPEIPSPEAGLPLDHIFSGGAKISGVTVTTDTDRAWDRPVGYRKPKEAAILILGAHSVVGMTVDLREYFPSLRGTGKFRVKWAPYEGAIVSDEVIIDIASRKQVVITVDQGKMVIDLFYDEAPAHVANFLDLAASGFYTGKNFHRSVPGYMIQGGCPRGDGSGIRLDGHRIASEVNHHKHEKGSVSMALLDDDPNSASCQFFITDTRVKDWDDEYTIFGELVGDESLATLDRLMAIPVDDEGRPTKTIYMRTVRVIDAPTPQHHAAP